MLQLCERNLDPTQWEQFLPDALHSIRSLLCTATNATPHERLFNYNRRTSNGCSLPVWLTTPGPVLLKRHVRASKYDPLIEEADPELCACETKVRCRENRIPSRLGTQW